MATSLIIMIIMIMETITGDTIHGAIENYVNEAYCGLLLFMLTQKTEREKLITII